jgi:hypothetical protein
MTDAIALGQNVRTPEDAADGAELGDSEWERR